MFLKTITAGPLGVNCYLIGCKRTKAGAVIDPGDDAPIILKTIKETITQKNYDWKVARITVDGEVGFE